MHSLIQINVQQIMFLSPKTSETSKKLFNFTVAQYGEGNGNPLLPGKFHGWRSLEGCSPWGRRGLDTTEQLHFHFSLSCIGEGNGSPLQCSCLENPRDRGAWWAALYGVAQSRTRLKRLSSSSSIQQSDSERYIYPFSGYFPL